jgi:beta-lactamase class A
MSTTRANALALFSLILLLPQATSTSPASVSGAPARSPARPSTDATASLEAELARVVAGCDGTVGIAAIHVETGERVGLNADTFYPMASVYKLPIGVAVLRQVEVGALRLADPVRISAEDYFPGYSPLRDSKRRRPVTVPVRELLERMLIDSDNTACDMLLRVAGGPERVTGELRALGIEDVTVSRSEAEMMADLYNAGPAPSGGWTFSSLRKATSGVGEAQLREGHERLLADSRDTATPVALSGLLVRLARGELLDAPHTRLILSLMERCHTGPARLRSGVPASARLAHKTGTSPGIGTVNDVGLMRLPDSAGRLAVAVLIKNARQDPRTCERVIAEAGRVLYEHFGARGAAPATR